MTVYIVGTFDLLHIGHLSLLEYCKTLGDTVIVGVASDEVVNSYKPNKPIIKLEERMMMLKSLSCVDIVKPYYELEYVSICKEFKPDIFVTGEDWGRKSHNIDVENYLEMIGSKIVQTNYHPQTSSSKIKQSVINQFLKNKKNQLETI